jgi:hypothetical protein
LPGSKPVVNAGLTALPLESAAALPKFAPLSLNCTVPVGVPLEPVEPSLTVAVNFTPLCPYADGLDDETTPVKLAALPTVCPPLNVPMLVMKSPSPL